jgi:hypothetical protein
VPEPPKARSAPRISAALTLKARRGGIGTLMLLLGETSAHGLHGPRQKGGRRDGGINPRRATQFSVQLRNGQHDC